MKEDRIRLNQESKDYVVSQLKTAIKPQLFIVLQWSPFALNYETAASHARHFKNVLLCQIYGCRLKELPEDKCRMAWFHEKVEVNINPHTPKSPKYRDAYHSNLHLGGLPEPYDSFWALDLLIKQKVSPRCHKLSKSNSDGNKGIVVKEWEEDNHLYYNFKDLHRYHHAQDGDLVIDYENSDLSDPK